MRFRYQYSQLLQFADTLALPNWIFDVKTRLFVIASIVALTVGYLFQVNNLSTSGYMINTLEHTLSDAAEQTDKLSTEVATYQSMASIQRRLSSLSMTTAANVKFVKATHDTAMAR